MSFRIRFAIRLLWFVNYLGFSIPKIRTPKHTDSKGYNKEVVLPMWSGNFVSYKVSPSTAAPHLSVTPKGSDGDFDNLRTSSCAFPALPQRLFYIVLMPWLSSTSSALHLLKADPFLGDKKRKNQTKHYPGVSSFVARVSHYILSDNLPKHTYSN